MMSETQIPVQVTITNDEIDKAIIDSLIGTQLGKKISDEIERCFHVGYGGVDMNRIVKGIVEKQIHVAIENILLVKHKDEINSFVEKKMTDEFVNSLFESMWERWSQR